MVVEREARLAAETNRAFVPVRSCFLALFSKSSATPKRIPEFQISVEFLFGNATRVY